MLFLLLLLVLVDGVLFLGMGMVLKSYKERLILFKEIFHFLSLYVQMQKPSKVVEIY